jgi:hypothetical protein
VVRYGIEEPYEELAAFADVLRDTVAEYRV